MPKEYIPLEKDIVNDMIDLIKSMGICFVIKTHGNIFQAAGLPDLITIAHGGRFVGIEAKRSEKHEPTSLQKKVLRWINKCGGYGFVAWSVKQVADGMQAAASGQVAPEIT